MALPSQLGDKEVQKFVETPDGKVSVRTDGVIRDGSADNTAVVSAAGELRGVDELNRDTLEGMKDLLGEILLQLKIITGEDR